MINIIKITDALTPEQIEENKQDGYCDKCKCTDVSKLYSVQVSKISSIDRKKKMYQTTDWHRVYCDDCFPSELLPFLEEPHYTETEAKFSITQSLSALIKSGFSIGEATEGVLGENINHFK